LGLERVSLVIKGTDSVGLDMLHVAYKSFRLGQTIMMMATGAAQQRECPKKT